ncbi:hypothetical protein [Prevotella sp.]|uniref:hypothetical protein n=1 Tax=Prevotella sp. TaxID=59823 RepID=UPI0025CF4023|nr:hypothetical protein [Prevotella sp.]
MEKIALESLRLIAADYVSQQVINELRSEGIYSIKNSPNVHVNVVLASTDKGADNVNEILETHACTRRNVVIKMNPELSIKEESDIFSILSFQADSNPYLELKKFLQLYNICIEKHGILCFDLSDFSILIRGRNVISTHSYVYKKDLTDAFEHIKSIYIKEKGRYLLAITIARYDNNEMEKMMLPLSDYLKSVPDKNIFYFTITEATPKTLTLFTSVPL